MSNLLDKASIILTPTAYNNGEALCVKPSDGSGDFDFSRNSAATRVNAQGLVENVQILSSNLVQNGDFSEEGVEEVSNGSFSQEGSELVIGGDFSNPSDWNLGGINLSISNGKGISTGSNFGAQFKQTILTINKTYKLVFDIVDYTSGAIGLTANYYGVAQTFNSVGTHTAYFTSLNQTELRLYSENFIGSIDNVSVREVGQDWSFVGDFEVNNQEASITNASQYSQLTNQIGTNYLLSGKAYKLTADIETLSISGALAYRYSGGAVQRIYTTDIIGGKFTAYFTMPQDGNFWFQTTANYTGLNATITNISVKEVGQNWDFVNADISIGNDGLEIISKGGNRPQANQNISGLTIGNKYKLSAVAKRGTCVEPVEIEISGIGSPVETNKNNTTEFANIFYQFIATSTIHTIQAKIDDGTSTIGETAFFKSVSVIEITDDTNLPRINYEGFSYQDALGSELVTNGDFATDSDWILSSGSTISGGSLNIIAAPYNANTRQTISLTSGKTYKIVIKATAIGSATDNTFQLGFGDLSGNPSDATQYEFEVGYSVKTLTVTASATDATIIFRSRDAGTSNLSIDNVSVKEYLGQEVVPDSGCGSWLFEPQSTNLVPYSEDFSSGNWFEYNETSATIDASQSNPSGANGSYKIESLSGLGRFGLSAITVAPSTNYTLSFYVKNINATLLKVILGSGASPGSYTYTSEVNTSNWSRVSVNFTTGAVTSMQIQFLRDLPIGESAYIWGAMLEQNSFSTSYIPTSGSSVTRNQDVCTNGGSLASINSTEGVLYAEIAALANSLNYRFISISDGTSNNRIYLNYSNASNQIQVSILVGGVQSYGATHNLSSSIVFNKIAVKWKLNDFSFYVNGVEVSTSNSNITFPANTLNKINFTNETATIFDFEGKTKAVAVWKEALSDEELTELTTI